MRRRDFLIGGATCAIGAMAATSAAPIPMGLNSYCLRALRWDDARLLNYAAGLKLDAMFLQDSLDPDRLDPAHWRKTGQLAKRLDLHIETGVGAILPKSPDAIDTSIATLRQGIRMASAMGSPVVRCLHASDRDHLPPGPIDQHIETMIRALKAVRSEAMDAGVKIAIENHKDLLCWEMREVMEGAGKEFVGSYLDTGNPVFVMEDPMTTLEVLGPYALTVHLRDSVIYEHKDGVAVQWVPLGEGVVDFRNFIARMREICRPVYVYIKPITGRPPAVLPYLDPAFFAKYRDIRGADFARFLALAKSGHPYEASMVIEDVPGSTPPEAYAAALQHQQLEHMERSVEYAKKTLDLGVKWRS
jgi:3-oxoisoapionate decarboxylase